MRIPPLRAAALGVAALVAALGLALGTVAPATADTVTTNTGQKLSIKVTGLLVAGRAVAQGTATITDGPTSITTVQVSFDSHEDITVGTDDRGRFEVNVPWAGALSVTVRAEATASDGTTASAVAEGRVAPSTRPSTRPRAQHRRLAETGPSGPRALGPLGAALLLGGIGLVTWSRRPDREA